MYSFFCHLFAFLTSSDKLRSSFCRPFCLNELLTHFSVNSVHVHARTRGLIVNFWQLWHTVMQPLFEVCCRTLDWELDKHWLKTNLSRSAEVHELRGAWDPLITHQVTFILFETLLSPKGRLCVRSTELGFFFFRAALNKSRICQCAFSGLQGLVKWF